MKNKNLESEPRKQGRPREFDREKGLDSAIEIFWAKGYSSTSLSELTGQMRINPPSLYGAFGNKHDLFLECLDRYAETIGRMPTEAFQNEQNIRQAVKALFDTTIQCATSPKRPKGCLLVSVATEMAASDRAVQKKMSRAYASRVAIVSERITAEQNAGRLPKNPDAERFAKMIISVTHGLVARARVGASRNELSDLAESFLDMLIPVSE